MIAPTVFSMIWFFVFGAAGIQADNQTNGAISSATGTSEALGLFAYLQQNPLFLLTSISMIFLVWIFFVAGADAGTIVLGSMSAGGVLNPKRTIKLTWGAIMGALAAILLLTGGLDALQNGAILAATPFAILMCLMCWCLYKTLRRDYREERERWCRRSWPTTRTWRKSRCRRSCAATRRENPSARRYRIRRSSWNRPECGTFPSTREGSVGCASLRARA